jgi:hypothetical protein
LHPPHPPPPPRAAALDDDDTDDDDDDDDAPKAAVRVPRLCDDDPDIIMSLCEPPEMDRLRERPMVRCCLFLKRRLQFLR